MLTGFEGALKVWPMIGAIAVGLIGFGEIRSDIHNLEVQQQQQFQSIQQQITNLQNEIISINDHK